MRQVIIITNSIKKTDVDGKSIRVNFEFVLVHEIDRALGAPHILASNGMESRWLTPDTLPCSGL